MGSNKKVNTFKIKLLTLAVIASLGNQSVLAAPTGASVVSGTASIATSGNTMTITNTPNAIINWASFGIAASETVRFVQQSSASAVLNRVTGNNPSQILGALQSNGKVFLINPNGIMFGAGARIDVNGLVASTLNMTDADFLNGRMRFDADRAIPGSVVNAGQITTPTGGFVYLLAPNVENSGVITTPSGEAILAAGNAVEIVNSTDPTQRVLVSATSQDINLSQLMTQSNGNIFSVLNSGKVSANTVVQDATGKIYFKSAGNIQTTASSVVEANGDSSANGGSFVGFADASGFYAGSFNTSGKNGGFIETSGHYLDLTGIDLNLRALDANGKGGTWLLDPYNIDIVAGGSVVNNGASPNFTPSGTSSQIGADLITAQLNVGIDVTIATGGFTSPGSDNGDIRILAPIITASTLTGTFSPSLTFTAYRDIRVDAAINGPTAGGRALNLAMTTSTGSIRVNDVIDTGAGGGGGTINLTANGSSSEIRVASGASLNSLTAVSMTSSGFSSNAIDAIVKTPSITATASNGNIRIEDLPGSSLLIATLNANPSTGSIDLFLDDGIVYSGATITANAGDYADVYTKNGPLSLTDVNISNSFGDLGIGTDNQSFALTITGGSFTAGDTTHFGELDVYGSNVNIIGDISGGTLLTGYGGVNVAAFNGTVDLNNTIIQANTSTLTGMAYVNVLGQVVWLDNNTSITATGGSNDAGIYVGGGTYNDVTSTLTTSVGAYVDVNTSQMTTSGYHSGISVNANDTSIVTSSLSTSGTIDSGMSLFGFNYLDVDNSILTSTSSTNPTSIKFVSQFLWITGGATNITADYIGLNYDPDFIQTNTQDFFNFISTATVLVDGGATVGDSPTSSTTEGIGFAGSYVEISGNASLRASSTSGGCSLVGGCMHGIADYLLLDNGHLYAQSEMLLEAGTAIDLINGGSINVASPNTLYFNFPLLASDGWFVDGVANAFTGSTGSYIRVAGATPILGTNFFVTYGGLGLVSAVLGNNFSALSDAISDTNPIATETSTAEDFFGADANEDDPKEEEKPQQCSA